MRDEVIGEVYCCEGRKRESDVDATRSDAHGGGSGGKHFTRRI